MNFGRLLVVRRRPLLIAALMLASGCTFFGPAPAISRSGLKPAPAQEAERVISKLNDAAKRLEILQLLSSLEIAYSGRIESFSQVLVFHQPDKLRFELFATELNKLVGLVIAQEDNIRALSPQRNVVYVGEASSASIERLLRLPLSPKELVLWQAGLSFLPPTSLMIDHHLSRSADARRGVLRCVLPQEKRVDIEFEESPGIGQLRIQQIEVAINGEQRLYSRYYYENANLEAAQELSLPTRIEFYLGEIEISGTLQLQQGNVNTAIEPERLGRLFTFPQTPSSRVLPLHLAEDWLYSRR